MFRYTVDKNNNSFKLYFGNGIFFHIDSNQYNKKIYDDFKVCLCQHKETSIVFKENDLELYFDGKIVYFKHSSLNDFKEINNNNGNILIINKLIELFDILSTKTNDLM